MKLPSDTSWLEAFTPQRLGMPASYTEFRPSQLQAIADIYSDETRVTAIQAPVGMGKSGIGIAVAKLLGYRTVYLTFTKALQDQLMRDFAPSGLKLIKGRNNYQCPESPHGRFSCEIWSRYCDLHACTIPDRHTCNAFDCDSWPGGCGYRNAFADAVHSDLTVANYAYWVNVQKRAASGLSTPANPVDLLILDEAHGVPDGLCDLLAIEIKASEIRHYNANVFPEDTDSIESWSKWAESAASLLAHHAETGIHTGSAKARVEYDKYCQKIGDLLHLVGDWVAEPIKDPHGWRITPVYAYQHVKTKLFHNAKKVLIMSGTLTRKTMSLMGLTPHDYSWHQYPYLFPKRSAPAYWIKTAQINYRTSQEDIELMYRTAANIIRTRNDRKGIIHTVSYKRCQEFLDWLKRFDMDIYKLTMTHQSHNTADVVAKFKRSKQPRVLVSPSITTGYDFPKTDCEYVVWMKLPFPMTKTPVMKARTDNDPTYPGYLMVQELVQGLGRGMRSTSDACECFILDDSWRWASTRFRNFLPSWLTVGSRTAIPPAPPSQLQALLERKSA